MWRVRRLGLGSEPREHGDVDGHGGGGDGGDGLCGHGWSVQTLLLDDVDGVQQGLDVADLPHLGRGQDALVPLAKGVHLRRHRRFPRSGPAT